MKINQINNINIFYKKDKLSKENNIRTRNNFSNSQPISYPQNYYVSFASKKTIGELYENRLENNMPTMVSSTLENMRSKGNGTYENWYYSQEPEKLQKLVFSSLAECKTVDDVKAKFPNEGLFKNLKQPNEVINGPTKEEQIWYQIMQTVLNGEKIASCEEDLTTFLIKKVFLECKSYKDVIQDLENVIIHPELKNLITEYRKESKIGHRIFKPLGLSVPNGIEYGLTLREGKGGIKKGSFVNLSPEEVTEKIKEYAQERDKMQLVLMDAWNNCIEARKTLSKFMFDKFNGIGSHDYGDIIMIGERLEQKKHSALMRKYMIEFWGLYPQYKKQLGDAIIESTEKFEVKKALGTEEFNTYQNEVIKKRSEIRTEIAKLKENYKLPNQKAREILQKVLIALKPLYLNDETSINQLMNLLDLSPEEIRLIEGEKTQEYTDFVHGKKGNCIRNKVIDLMKTSDEYRKILNAQSLSILTNILETNDINEDDLNIILQNRNIYGEFIKQAIKAQKDENGQRLVSIKGANTNIELPININISSVYDTYDSYNASLTQIKKEKIKETIFKTCSGLSEEDKGNISEFLSKQGNYMGLILGNNKNLKTAVLTIFCSDLDKKYNTNVTEKLLNSLNIELIHQQKLDYIENEIDWTTLISSVWNH